MIRSILAFVHGMVVDRFTDRVAPRPISHAPMYDDFWRRLVRAAPALDAAFPDRYLGIEYAHLVDGEVPTGDRLLPLAQYYVARRCLPEVSGAFGRRARLGTPLEAAGRLLGRPLKEKVLMRGLADVAYYCSPDGEAAIRAAVFGALLRAGQATAAERIRLHLVCHSLGVAVVHDLLFALFNPSHEPRFAGPDRDSFLRWRERARSGRIELGTWVTLGGQLPILAFRAQRVVDRLAAGRPLDPRDIGLDPAAGRVQWLDLYDPDDLLGFPGVGLYGAPSGTREVEVQTGWRPDEAHGGYWRSPEVASLVARAILASLGGRSSLARG